MKNKIIEILFKRLSNKTMFDSILIESVASEIETNYYPKEFVEWKDNESGFICDEGMYSDYEGENRFTLDGLYEFWKSLPNKEKPDFSDKDTNHAITGN